MTPLLSQIYMFSEWYKPGCCLEYPLNGSGAIVDALVRGLQKFGGQISLRSHVENIVVEGGQAVGVKLRSGQVSKFWLQMKICISLINSATSLLQIVRARKAVVSNASMWDTLKLLPEEFVPKSYADRIKSTPQCESFIHLHLGFDAEVSNGKHAANFCLGSYLSKSRSLTFLPN